MTTRRGGGKSPPREKKKTKKTENFMTFSERLEILKFIFPHSSLKFTPPPPKIRPSCASKNQNFNKDFDASCVS